MVEDNEKAILEAVTKDLGRHPFETTMTDIAGVKHDILDHIDNLEKWTADEIPDAGFFFGTVGKARLRREPLGVVLILGTWNFPIATALQPFVAAIAAGNCTMLKPSEVAQASMRLLEELVPKYLDSSAIRCVTGGPQETSFILEQRFDHIFFTGSDKIGRIVAQAAARNLTSTTLECGGQNPTIVTKTANVDLAAKRIANAKLLNAGQICLSVNHIFADPAIHDELVERLKSWNDKLYKGNESQLPHIVSEKHIDRLQNLLDATKGHVEYRSPIDKQSKSFGPTIVTNVTMEGRLKAIVRHWIKLTSSIDSLLSDEIFGPILAIIKATPREAYDFIEEWVDTLTMHKYRFAYYFFSTPGPPLGAYIFSQDRKEIDEGMTAPNYV